MLGQSTPQACLIACAEQAQGAEKLNTPFGAGASYSSDGPTLIDPGECHRLPEVEDSEKPSHVTRAPWREETHARTLRC